jgi:hypothetical protein
MFTRYAVFYTCDPASDLGAFGAAWLGWDIATGTQVPRPVVQGVDVGSVTKAPHKYGFHGTIKAPFRLGPDTSEAALEAAFVKACTRLDACPLQGLHLAQLGRFWALVPDGDNAALQGFSGHVVETLDAHRAPLTAQEIAKRNPDRLTDRQRAHLEQWGYPFVKQDFRFHMTLTDRLPKDQSPLVQNALQQLLAHTAMPSHIEALTLMGEGAEGRFHQIKRWALG